MTHNQPDRLPVERKVFLLPICRAIDGHLFCLWSHHQAGVAYCVYLIWATVMCLLPPVVAASSSHHRQRDLPD